MIEHDERLAWAAILAVLVLAWLLVTFTGHHGVCQ